MNDSSDDGLCDGDSNLKKDSNSNSKTPSPEFFERKDSKIVQKKFMCGRCDRGLWGAVFYNKNVTIETICYKT